MNDALHSDAVMAAQFRALLESTSQGIVGADREGTILLANHMAETMFGYGRGELLGQKIEVLVPERMRHIHRAERSQYVQAPRHRPAGIGMELRGRRRDGSEFPVEISLNHLAVEGRDMTLGLVTDISTRVAMEDQLRQALKMESIGRLAGGVAHDFNNLLTVITGYSSLALSSLNESSQPLRAPLEEIARAADRAARLTQQLLAFSRRQAAQPKRLNLNDHLSQSAALLKSLVGENVNLELKLAKGVGEILADPAQIDQAVVNLAMNARDAMPGGGHLRIETAAIELDAAGAARHLPLSPGPHVTLAVTDNGAGMSPEVQAHIFEPFFTTKEVGQGPGLGLAAVYGIVKQAGAAISVTSKPGAGTTFTLVFPRAGGDADVNGGGGESRPATETILLVEDEDAVRHFVSLALSRLGYRVQEAKNGKEALEIVERCGAGAFDLVLTDIVMPGLGGPELVAEIRRRGYSGLKALFMSGYSGQSGLEREGGEDTAFIRKPFNADQLHRKLREMLGRDLREGRAGGTGRNT